MNSTVNWVLKEFNDLSSHELYAIMQLRSEVFILEQHCIYQDADNKDQPSGHLMGWLKDKLVAYTRLLPPGIAYKEPSIGRVITSPSVRGSGIGRELMKRSIAEIYKVHGPQPVKIGAQLYLQKFYSSFGFQQTSDIYLEDNIEHIEMVLEYSI